MVTSLTDLANQALRRLGAGRVSSIDGTQKEAVVLKEVWPQARDEVLREFDWSCAIERDTLAQLSTSNLTEYDYAYQLPADCLRVICMIVQEGTKYWEYPQLAFRIEGGKLYTDESTCAIKYVKKITDPSVFDSTLIEAMAYRWAAVAAFEITQSTEIEQKMLSMYGLWLEKAKNVDALERAEEIRSINAWGFDTAIADEGVP